MNHRVGLGAFGTFGEPFGYQQVFFLDAVFSSSLDLNANAIEVYPGAELYAVKREIVNGSTTVCCCLYTYAKELNTNRGGTFIGSCIVLSNSYLKGDAIYSLLRELHTDLLSNPKNIVDNALQVQKAGQLVVTEPAGFAAMQAKATTAAPAGNNAPVDTSKKFLIQAPSTSPATEPSVARFFEDAITYFTDTDTLYFTTHKQVIAYVAEKGLIPLADWEAFQHYKSQKQQQEKEAKQKAEVLRKKEKPQQGKISAPVAKTFGLYELWTEGKPDKDAFKKMVDNHNALLKEYLQIKEHREYSSVAIQNSTAYGHKSNHSSFRIRKKHLAVTVIVLFILLVTTSCLLLFRTAGSAKEMVAAPASTPIADSTVPQQNSNHTEPLSPLPNTELAKSEVAKLAKEKLKGKNLRNIIDAIFLKNPVAVAAVYSWQKKEYADFLLRQNKACFAEDSAGYSFICDTLLHIPAFKK